jgi:hypothetical protein
MSGSLEVVCGGEVPDFGGSEAVAVGEQGDGIITFRVYGIEQTAGFILRQKIDGGRCPTDGRFGGCA